MDDLTRVKGPASPLEGRPAKIVAVIVIAILVAIIKPWGDPPPLARAPLQTAEPTSGPSPSPLHPWALYDHELFGIYEPAARWELWPAGYVVSFGYATRIGSAADVPDGTARPTPSSAPAASDDPAAAPTPTPTPVPTPAPDGGPVWPTTITISAANKLGFLGVNMPLEYHLEGVAVTRSTDGGPAVPVEVMMPTSQWPGHFKIIGLAGGADGEPLEEWPAGHYEVTLEFAPGDISRTIMIDIVPGPGGDGASPSRSPGS